MITTAPTQPREVALLCDPHFGVRNQSPIFQAQAEKFYEKIFFPTLQSLNIRELVILGDLFDNRKIININILHRTRKCFLDVLELFGIETYCIVGNHDAYYRDSNSVNSVKELTAQYSNFHVFDKAVDLSLKDVKVFLLPWITPSTQDDSMVAISKSSSPVLLGHIEVVGFPVHRGSLCVNGLSRDVFKKFKKVLSGHFHTQSMDGNIQYLGAASEHTFQDAGEPKGFHLMNPHTLDLRFIQNPYILHHNLSYDDRVNASHDHYMTSEVAQYANCFLKIHVHHKTTPRIFERWLERLEQVNPASISVLEDFTLDHQAATDTNTLVDPLTGQKSIVTETTADVLERYIDEIPNLDVDPQRLKDLLREIHIEAIHVNDDAE